MKPSEKLHNLLNLCTTDGGPNGFIDDSDNEILHQETSIVTCFFENLKGSILSLEKEETDEDHAKILLQKTRKIIHGFFALRAKKTAFTHLGYTEAPFTAINQHCTNVASAIADPNKGIALTLMPFVKLSEPDSTFSVKNYTEDNHFFNASQFLLCEDGRLIHIEESLLGLAKLNTDHLFQTENGLIYGAYKLTVKDLHHLRHISGKATQVYYDALELFHYQKNNTLQGKLEVFVRALHASSKNGQGQELRANLSVLREPLATFFVVWENLEVEERKKIEDLTIIYYEYPELKVSLKVLLTYIKIYAINEKILTADLSEEDFEMVKDFSPHVLPCTAQLSRGISKFCQAYRPLFSSILISHEEKIEAPDNLDVLHDIAISSLSQRKLITISSDYQPVPPPSEWLNFHTDKMANILFSTLDPNKEEGLKRLKNSLSSYNDLHDFFTCELFKLFELTEVEAIVLLQEHFKNACKRFYPFYDLLNGISSPEGKVNLITILDNADLRIVIKDNYELKKVLSLLPEAGRLSLINALGEAHLRAVIKDEYELESILKLLPEAGQLSLIDALGKVYFTTLIHKKYLVLSFLIEKLSEVAWKKIVHLLKPGCLRETIEIWHNLLYVLKKSPIQGLKLIMTLSKEDLFKLLFKKNLSLFEHALSGRPPNLESFLMLFPEIERTNIITILGEQYLIKIIDHSYYLEPVLKALSEAGQSILLTALGEQHLRKIIDSSYYIKNFLTTLSEANLLHLFTVLGAPHLREIIKNSRELEDILKKLPQIKVALLMEFLGEAHLKKIIDSSFSLKHVLKLLPEKERIILIASLGRTHLRKIIRFSDEWRGVLKFCPEAKNIGPITFYDQVKRKIAIGGAVVASTIGGAMVGTGAAGLAGTFFTTVTIAIGSGMTVGALAGPIGMIVCGFIGAMIGFGIGASVVGLPLFFNRSKPREKTTSSPALPPLLVPSVNQR